MSKSIAYIQLNQIGPIVVRPKQAALMLSCGIIRIYELMNTGQLKSFKDDGARKILVSSIEDYVKRKSLEKE